MGSCSDTGDPYFDSKNFYNVLRWERVDSPGQVVLYSVEYNVYGNPFVPVMECQNISVTFCDLTALTVNDGSRYYARVQANGQLLGYTARFNPMSRTAFGAPEVSATYNVSSVMVTVRLPQGPGNRSIADIACQVNCSSKPPVEYKLTITHPESKAGMVIIDTSGRFVFNHSVRSTEYCGYVVYTLTHPGSPQQSDNATFCITVPGDPWSRIFIVPGLIAFLLLLSLSAGVCWTYITKEKSMPKSLDLSKTGHVLHLINTQDTISRVVISPQFFSQVELKTAEPCALTSHDSPKDSSTTEGSYAVQVCHAQSCSNRTYRDQQQVSRQQSRDSTGSSTNYSMVVHVQISTCDPKEDAINLSHIKPSGLKPQEESEPVLISQNAPPGPEIVPQDQNDSNNDLLMVPVLHNKDGVLQIPGLTEMESSTSNLGNCEKIPLLSGLIFDSDTTPSPTDWMEDLDDQDSESGEHYATTYVSNQVLLPTCMESTSYHPQITPLNTQTGNSSNYRKNWVPGMQAEIQEQDSSVKGRNYILQTWPDPDETEKLGTGGIFLEGWMVQIKG
ncbi:interferon lambda receptor 1 [Chanos chanos]|uniref:Interferon lambda receptor 1 n=1 Tax=Chanos chanos TaxID=29144 RepID=A0A6J2W4H0_CHACN|nr:interleukin-22 receptor subunit alpha-1-like [Chanos chanos]